MTQELISTRVIELVAKASNREPSPDLAQHRFDELGLDSLDTMSLIFDIEEAFDLAVSEDEISQVRTVGELIEGVHLLVSRTLPAT